jgi:hypothetical protein
MPRKAAPGPEVRYIILPEPSPEICNAFLLGLSALVQRPAA